MLEDERNLVARAKGGESEAFGLLYDFYMPRIYRFILFKVDRREEAEDLTHQTFLKAWESIEKYESRGYPFSSWLYRIARNNVIDQYRRSNPRISIEDISPELLVVEELQEIQIDANGFVLEAKKDKQRGITANLILKEGVLKRGDQIVTKGATGKIKILEDFLGKASKEMLPSSPATVGIFDELPQSGDEFWADSVDIEVVGVLGGETPGELTQAIHIKSEKEKGSINAILKADSVGSLEALKQVLEVLVEIKQASVGEITDGDVQFAKSTESIIVGFRVKAGKSAEKLADAQETKIIISDIIYKLVETIEEIDTSEAEAEKGGTLEVLAAFSGTASKQTIGGKVTEGRITLGSRVEIIREEDVLGKGKIKSLQQDKTDVKEVLAGNECGLVIETEVKIEKGDIIKSN